MIPEYMGLSSNILEYFELKSTFYVNLLVYFLSSHVICFMSVTDRPVWVNFAIIADHCIYRKAELII